MRNAETLLAGPVDVHGVKCERVLILGPYRDNLPGGGGTRGCGPLRRRRRYRPASSHWRNQPMILTDIE